MTTIKQNLNSIAIAAPAYTIVVTKGYYYGRSIPALFRQDAVSIFVNT